MSRLALRYGFGNGDNPVFARMHETSALVTGASVQAAEAVRRRGPRPPLRGRPHGRHVARLVDELEQLVGRRLRRRAASRQLRARSCARSRQASRAS